MRRLHPPSPLSALARLLSLSLLLSAPSLPAAIETWTNLDGLSMQAEFLGRKGDYVTFRKDDGSRYLYPYAKLTDADRTRIDALASSSSTAASSPAGSSSDTSASPAKPPAAPAAAKPGEVTSALAGKLVALKGKTLASVPRDQLDDTRYLAFYYSAKWCPPCRAFTPELVETYAAIKAKHPGFELVFVSSDEDTDAMKDYMAAYKMPWPALRFDQIKTTRATRRPAHERGIPNLVFMDADGKELSLSYTPKGQYRGPQAVLADIKKHFAR